jgi:hypothetical protein
MSDNAAIHSDRTGHVALLRLSLPHAIPEGEIHLLLGLRTRIQLLPESQISRARAHVDGETRRAIVLKRSRMIAHIVQSRAISGQAAFWRSTRPSPSLHIPLPENVFFATGRRAATVSGYHSGSQ